MNFLSKKSIFGLIVFLLLAGTLIYLSNNREVQATTSNAAMTGDDVGMLVSNVADEAMRPAPFDFKFVVSKCKGTKPLVTVAVVIMNEVPDDNLPRLYRYDWVVDGKPMIDQGPVLSCFCAKKVDVTVTRVKDNQRVMKSIRLYACIEREPSINYPEE